MGNTDDTNVYNTLEKLMDSHVPKFAYERDEEDRAPYSGAPYAAGIQVASSSSKPGNLVFESRRIVGGVNIIVHYPLDY